MANDIQIVVDSSDLQRAVDWMDKMGQSGKKLGTRTKTLQQEFDKYNRRLKQNQAELKRIKMATDPVYAADQKLKNMKRLLRSEIEQGNMSLREAGAEMLRYRKSVNSMTTAVQLSGKAARRKEVAFQQAGYQVQDFIVQVQAGTNPLIAFSQQGSQLAGFFAGPWGAAIGVGIAALSTFAMVILSLKRDMGDFKKELDEVNDSIALAGSGAGSAGMLAANLKLMDAYDNLSATREGVSDLLMSGDKDLVDLANFEIGAAQKKVDIASQERQGLQSKIDQLKTINALSGSEVLEAQNLQANMARQARARKTAADEAKKLADEQAEINKMGKEQLRLQQQQTTLSELELEFGKDSRDVQLQKQLNTLSNLRAKLEEARVDETIIEAIIAQKAEQLNTLRLIELKVAAAARLKGQFDEAFKTRTLEYKLRFSGEATVMGQSVTASGKKMKPKQSYEELIALGMSPEQIENLFGMKAPKGKRGLKQQIDDTRELSEVQKQQVAIADSVSSSFGDMFMTMVDGTTSAKDAFRSMATDIIQQQNKIHDTEQLVKSISGAITGAFTPAPYAGEGTAPPVAPRGNLLKLDGGGYTGSGPRSGGLDGKGGFMAMLHPRETVVDHTKGQGAGGTTVNQTFNISANTSDDTKRLITQTIAQASPSIINQSVGAVMNQRRRGGSMKSAFG